MARGTLARRHVEGIGEGSLVGTFATLMQLTSEAVLAFDGSGRVLLANEEAERLMGASDTAAGEAPVLGGADIRDLFPKLDGPGDDDAHVLGFSTDDLPFACDGSTRLVSFRASDGSLGVARVRCELVQAPGETYLMVAAPVGEGVTAGHEYDRTVDDLRRANHRLAGALKIVLDTIDSQDMGELLDRVLEEIRDTMEADGTLIYLAESDGFRLRGATDGTDVSRTPRFMQYGRTVETMATREGRAVRLRVQPPSGDDLRAGKLTARDVVNEATHEILRVKSNLLPPFASFVVVPVWFGGHVIAIIEVGWKHARTTSSEDARLLDSVAHYLSVQLVGAFSTLRAQRATSLDTFENDLREELMGMAAERRDEALAEAAGDGGTADDAAATTLVLTQRLTAVMQDVADELEACLVGLSEAPSGAAVAKLPLSGARELPNSLDVVVRDHVTDGAAVVELGPSHELSAWLRDLGEPCVGALVDLGQITGERLAYLLLRPDGAEPMDDVELTFLVRLASDVRDIARGEAAREQDKHISQALQSGMRNELQLVEGITAQGVYSSATAAAFVGGDFYDLIRLPERRACVIMGDVSGKGVEAASVSAAVKTALGAYAWEGLAPARMVRSLNDFLLGFSRVETFATLFVGLIDLARCEITYCSAGHPPALIARHEGAEISILDVQSGVVGAFPDIAYRDGRVAIDEGDVLLLYTDGTTEARDPKGAFFGEQGLRDMVMRETAPGKPYEGLLDRLLATLDDFTGQRLDDDVAMVSLRFDKLG